jgi:hypothetical protein
MAPPWADSSFRSSEKNYILISKTKLLFIKWIQRKKQDVNLDIDKIQLDL